MTVSSEQRGRLSRAVSRLRVLFEDDYADALEGTYGIHVSGRRAGEIENPDSLSLSAHLLAARGELVGVVEYLRGEGLDAVEAVERVLREAVFTTVNRLLAVRVAEAIGVLPPSLSEGRNSLGFVETLEVFPLLRDADDSGGYWSYLQVCGDELSHAVPRLFDRRHPLSVLEPSSETLDAAVEALSDPDVDGVWVEPEALGWSYQFFNTQEERKKMRDESAAPRNSRELAVRNQFFTPSYVVEFLVENTLGRRLRESGSELELQLFLGEIDDDAPLLVLDDVSVLDPAVGSGHFLLGAYDLLERAWGEQGVSPAEAAPTILGSLFGVDIDPRAAQVAQAVLYLRARRSAPDGVLDAPSIVTARGLPRDPVVWDEVLKNAFPLVRDVVQGLGAVLEQAPVLGSLLKPEEYLKEAIGERLDTPRLGDDELGSFEDVEAMVRDAAERIASEAAATPAERLFAAAASDALGFVDIMARRYDTVLMNPPFGEPIPGTKEYIKAAYPWIPWKDYNVLAAFVGRGAELINVSGQVGAITSRSAFFLATFEAWRREVVLHQGLSAFADLGFGVMSDATVEAAAFTVGSGCEIATFVNLLRADDKGDALRSSVVRYRTSGESDTIDEVPLSDLRSIPGARFNYSVPDQIRRLYVEFPSLSDSNGTEVRVGLQTSDDFRFIRTYWEIDPSQVSQTRDDLDPPKGWVLLAKGGEYSPYLTDHHLVINWANDGIQVREFDRSVIRSPNLYFLPGLTWPERTNSAFAPQVLPAGAIFSVKGPLVWTRDQDDRLALLAWLNSRVVRLLVETSVGSAEGTKKGGVPSRDYSAGLVAGLPNPIDSMPASLKGEISRKTALLVAELQSTMATDETTRLFEMPEIVRHRAVSSPDRIEAIARQREDSALRVLELHFEIEQEIHSYLDLDDRSGLLDEVAGPQRSDLPAGDLSEQSSEVLADLYPASLSKVLDVIARRKGKWRFAQLNYHVVDRRLESLAFMIDTNPRSLVAERRRRRVLPGRLESEVSADLLSWLVGVAFGRFDSDVGRVSERANRVGSLFEPLPRWQPGQNQISDSERHGVGLLFDDPLDSEDIVQAIVSAAGVVFEDGDTEIRQALQSLSETDLRDYLRGAFQGDHVVRYSKSRRKAPIYWYLAVPSKEWGLWVYAPWLSREQLFAIARAARDKMRRLSDEASQLRRDVEAGGGRADRERLEAVEALLEEVAGFHRVADGVAQSGWEPDLNDGIILNAAPLQELFADKKWRTDIEKHRKKMINGDYPWATVQTSYYDRIES